MVGGSEFHINSEWDHLLGLSTTLSKLEGTTSSPDGFGFCITGLLTGLVRTFGETTMFLLLSGEILGVLGELFGKALLVTTWTKQQRTEVLIVYK